MGEEEEVEQVMMPSAEKKASMKELNKLHGQVAMALTEMVRAKDTRAITAAINFLAKNDVTVDLMESKETKSLFSEVKDQIDNAEGINSLEDVLEYYKDHK